MRQNPHFHNIAENTSVALLLGKKIKKGQGRNGQFGHFNSSTFLLKQHSSDCARQLADRRQAINGIPSTSAKLRKWRITLCPRKSVNNIKSSVFLGSPCGLRWSATWRPVIWRVISIPQSESSSGIFPNRSAPITIAFIYSPLKLIEVVLMDCIYCFPTTKVGCPAQYQAKTVISNVKIICNIKSFI